MPLPKRRFIPASGAPPAELIEELLELPIEALVADSEWETVDRIVAKLCDHEDLDNELWLKLRKKHRSILWARLAVEPLAPSLIETLLSVSNAQFVQEWERRGKPKLTRPVPTELIEALLSIPSRVLTELNSELWTNFEWFTAELGQYLDSDRPRSRWKAVLRKRRQLLWRRAGATLVRSPRKEAAALLSELFDAPADRLEAEWSQYEHLTDELETWFNTQPSPPKDLQRTWWRVRAAHARRTEDRTTGWLRKRAFD